jgi:hypothetical protein
VNCATPRLGDWFECSLQFLDYQEIVCHIELVCRQWRRFVESRPQLWRSLCKHLWAEKVYVPPAAIDLLKQPSTKLCDGVLPQKMALLLSVVDSRRVEIQPHELCQFEWSIKFHLTIGPDFVFHDPYWNGQKARTVRFLRAGNRVEYLGPRIAAYAQIYYNAPKRWHLQEDTLTISHFPRYRISRHKNNWGFMIDNSYVLLTSWPMPSYGQDPIIDQGEEYYEEDDEDDYY